jgi:hypothetical protein
VIELFCFSVRGQGFTIRGFHVHDSIAASVCAWSLGRIGVKVDGGGNTLVLKVLIFQQKLICLRGGLMNSPCSSLVSKSVCQPCLTLPVGRAQVANDVKDSMNTYFASFHFQENEHILDCSGKGFTLRGDGGVSYQGGD